MLKITLIHAGDFRESYFKEAETEYKKRLSAYCEYKTVLIRERDTDNTPFEKALAAEACDIRAAIPKKAFCIALCIEGKKFDSKAFADKLCEIAQNNGEICFIIGSSHGLDEGLKNECGLKLSMSDMTFPHRLARIMLAEQVYRAFTIINNKKYHK